MIPPNSSLSFLNDPFLNSLWLIYIQKVFQFCGHSHRDQSLVRWLHSISERLRTVSTLHQLLMNTFIVFELSSVGYLIMYCITMSLEGFCLSNTLKCTNWHYFSCKCNAGIPKLFCHLNLVYLIYLLELPLIF